MSKKRQREKTTAQARNVEIFEDLAHENAEIRLNAAKQLLSSVSDDKNPSRSDVEIILNRLIRGLCSARKVARFGYAIALTELLVQLWGPGATRGEKLGLSIPNILTLIEKQTDIGDKAQSMEIKDHYFGRLFAEEAVIKSAILFQGKADDEEWERLLDVVFSLAKRKSWLRELCGWTLYQALDVIQGQSKVKRYARALVKRLPDDGFSETPEGVAVWLKALHLAVDVKMPKGVWRKKNPLHPKELTKLTTILKESSSIDDSTTAKKAFKSGGTWSSNLHFVWDEIISYLLTRDQQSGQKHVEDVTFEKFWVTAIDESLFTTVSSEERKYWGYLLFQQSIQRVQQANILTLFTENFLRCLANHSSSSDHVLYAMAQKSLSALVSRAEKDQSSVPILVEGVLRAIVYANFDKLIRTKHVEKLIANSEPFALQTIVSKLDQLILNPGTKNEDLAAARRQSIANILVNVLRLRSIQKGWEAHEDSSELQILLIFLVHANFSSTSTMDGAKELPNPPLSKESRKLFNSKLGTCLTTILTQSKDSIKPFVYLLKAINTLETSSGPGKIERLCSEISSSAIRKAQAHWDLLKRPDLDASDGETAKALNLLVAATMVQAYSDDEDAVNLLRDLADCAIMKENGEEKMLSESIVDILLTLISKPSVFARRIVMQVLDTEESVTGHIELYEGADEALENGVVQNGGSDVEMADDEEPDSSSEGSDSESGDNLEEEAADVEELASFNAKLAEALGTRPGEEDLNAAESTSTDGEDMDDKQMEALDATLEKVFRERVKVAKKKNEANEAKQNIVLFKTRVLELLDTYVKYEYSNGLCAKIIIPFIQSIRKTRSRQVSGKIFDLLREYNRHYKLKDHLKAFTYTCDHDSLWTILKDVHHAAVRGSDANVYQSACSQASMLVAKLLIANCEIEEKESVVKGIIDVYAQSQQSFLQDESSKVRPALFSDWVNWMASNRKAIIAQSMATGVKDDDLPLKVHDKPATGVKDDDLPLKVHDKPGIMVNVCAVE